MTIINGASGSIASALDNFSPVAPAPNPPDRASSNDVDKLKATASTPAPVPAPAPTPALSANSETMPPPIEGNPAEDFLGGLIDNALESTEDVRTIKDAQWWLEPAGYAKLAVDNPFPAHSIKGVLQLLPDLVGVTTIYNHHFWLSKAEHPRTFEQVASTLGDLRQRYQDIPDDEERAFQVGGYTKFDASKEHLEVKFVKGVYIDGDKAAFIAEVPNLDGWGKKFEHRYVDKSDEEDFFADLVKWVELKRNNENTWEYFGGGGLANRGEYDN